MCLDTPPPSPRLPCPSLVLSRSCVSLAVRLERLTASVQPVHSKYIMLYSKRLTASVSTCLFQIQHAVSTGPFQTQHAVFPNEVNRIRQPMPERPPFEPTERLEVTRGGNLRLNTSTFSSLGPFSFGCRLSCGSQHIKFRFEPTTRPKWSCISGITPYR